MSDKVNTCPICNSKQFESLHTVKDVWVSKESFHVIKCKECTLGITEDAPSESEIGKYYEHEDYISHTDTKEGLFFKVYHWVRDFMFNKKQGFLKNHVSKGKHLDIGAGTGYFVNYMNQNGWDSSGVEVDKNAALVAEKKFNIKLKNHLNEVEETEYQAISMWHVLEHVHTLNEYFDYFKKLLSKNGKVFIAVPNYTSFDAQFYKEHWAAWDVPKHLWHFSPKAMNKLAEKHHFQIEKKYILPFDPFYISLISAKNKGNSFFNKIGALYAATISFLGSVFNTNKASSVVYVLKQSK